MRTLAPVVLALLLLTGCRDASPPTGGGTEVATATGTASPGQVHPDPDPAATTPTKVLLVVEENTEAEDVLTAGRTPYLSSLVPMAASVTRMDAGYPRVCPSLPAYLLLTSGSRHGICDDAGPARHQIDGPSIFSEIVDAGQQWRVFTDGTDEHCRLTNGEDGRYLVRHTAAPYYASEKERCRDWQVPTGSTTGGPLREAVDQGLPAFSLVVPDRCHDMHGGEPCTGDRVTEGDRWLRGWLPEILAGPDYAAGRLLVVVTWDEGTLGSNDIATLLLHPGLAGTTVDRPATHCDTLATMAQVLDVPAPGCAIRAEPLVTLPGPGH